MRTAKSVYRRFVDFEERSAAIYVRLASRFSSDRMLSAFWLEMAMEEKQHAGLVQFCLAEELFSAELPSDTELEKLNVMVKGLEKRASNSEITVDDAFLLAFELERSEVNSIYCRLTATAHPSTYLVKRKIATFVPHHVNGLVAAARKFRVSGKTLKQVEKLDKSCA